MTNWQEWLEQYPDEEEGASERQVEGGLALTEQRIHCPYCGEPLDVLLDPQEVGQQYIEDCQVCCRPMTMLISEAAGGELEVNVWTSDDVC